MTSRGASINVIAAVGRVAHRHDTLPAANHRRPDRRLAACVRRDGRPPAGGDRSPAPASLLDGPSPAVARPPWALRELPPLLGGRRCPVGGALPWSGLNPSGAFGTAALGAAELSRTRPARRYWA